MKMARFHISQIKDNVSLKLIDISGNLNKNKK